MSDGAAPLATTSETGTPSTRDIVASVVDTAEQQSDTGTESAGYAEPADATESTTESDTAQTEPTKAELSAAAKFLQKLGHSEMNKRGGNTYLPYRTVEKMLEKYADEHSTSWTSERSTLETQAKTLQGHLEQLRAAVAGEPEAFLRELAGLDTRYARFLQAQAQPEVAAPKMPDPDLPLQDGSRTYSVEGIQKLIEWAVEARMAPKVDERLKPLLEARKADEARAQQDAFDRTQRERFQQQMSEAQAWPHFGKIAEDGSLTEFQSAVLKELQADSEKANAEGRRPSLTLEGAYIKAVSKRITEDDTTRRQRLMKEIASAPTSTATGAAPVDSPRAKGQVNTRDIVARVVAQAEKNV